jgi:HNH endonuclease
MILRGSHLCQRLPNGRLIKPDPLSFAMPEPNTGCWIWIGKRRRNGYGEASNPQRLAHRVIYELMHGKIPRGLQIDHLCRNRWCVNPSHLEPVTIKENLRRGMGSTGIGFRSITCMRGHAYKPKRHRNGTRHCQTCNTLHQRHRYYQNRLKALMPALLALCAAEPRIDT